MTTPPDPTELAKDWITLIESELSALATDREAQETFQALLALWAGSAAVLLRAPLLRTPADDSARTARPAAPSGPAPAAAASGVGDAALNRLRDRVAELEARLARLEGDPGTGHDNLRPAGHAKPNGKPNGQPGRKQPGRSGEASRRKPAAEQ